jgi:hypothetical protein
MTSALAVIAMSEAKKQSGIYALIFWIASGYAVAMTATPNEPDCHYLLFVTCNIPPTNDATPNGSLLSFVVANEGNPIHSASK